MLAPPAHDDDELHGYRGLIPVLEEFDKPLLAAVNGVGVGFGATLLPYCDIVWMDPAARAEGAVHDPGGHHRGRRQRAAPPAHGLAGRRALHLHGQLALRRGGGGLRAGLPGRARRARVVAEAMETARQIGGLSVDSLQTTKRLMVAARLDAGRAARQREDQEFVRMVGNQTNADALADFLKKG